MGRPHHFEGSNEYPQHLTWTTKDRLELFADPLAAMVCLWALDKELKRIRQDAWGYALMPDHLHLLIGPSFWPTGSIVHWLKVTSAYYLKSAGKVSKSPWARGYWDRAIREERDLVAAIEYLHDNPVKAGIACYEGWPLSSWQDYEERGASILSIKPAPI